jgi:hypothetical protein
MRHMNSMGRAKWMLWVIAGTLLGIAYREIRVAERSAG